ncbi:conserved hypothetical protein [Ricinus communis]|uniref:BSD2 cysteine rich domain-containing protein n=2 Tax=Ricinus communis TaxID=3988 RepID=B9RP55_RICCO|nr:conserved hypothetical protein [Ricinus communis]
MATCLSLQLPIRAMEDSGFNGGSSRKQETLGIHDLFQSSFTGTARRCYLKTRAAPSDQNPKPKSVICTDCDGNGAVLCSQCKGSGVNSVDIFNGQFKAGDSCWLCGGKKDMLCGNCNGAGFLGGFMSTFDE